MSPASRGFLDTNILVYAFSTDAKSTIAESLIARGCMVGPQGLNEFANVARRKLKLSWTKTREALAAIRKLCPIAAPLDLSTHESALDLGERWRLPFFDAAMIAAALRAGCDVFWSEDLEDQMLIEGTLRIKNPFVDGVQT